MKRFSEKNFKEIINDVGLYNYRIYDKGESLPGEVLKRELAVAKYNCVIAASGCTISDYGFIYPEQPNIVIPGGAPITIVRLLRYDDKHAEPHYNADDQILFPTKSGDIYRLSRRDAPDHFIGITTNSSIASIADAYNLPEEKSGPIEKYSAKGANLHINIIPVDSDEGYGSKKVTRV